MTVEHLHGIAERAWLWREHDDPCVGLEDVEDLLAEVWRLRRSAAHSSALMARTRDATARITAYHGEVLALVRTHAAQLAGEQSQEGLTPWPTP
jgi:hypothetical protein